MLKRIADRAAKEEKVLDQDGQPCTFKLLNTQYLGIRKLHTDVQGVVSPQSRITVGSILTHVHGDCWTVSMVTADYYKGAHIRNCLDMVENNNKVTVTRPVITKSAQGGITGKTETVIYTDIPVKVGTLLQVRDQVNDTTDSQFAMLLSVKFPVQMGDHIEFASHYSPAKVEGIKLNYEGIYEITFDKEPRWNFLTRWVKPITRPTQRQPVLRLATRQRGAQGHKAS